MEDAWGRFEKSGSIKDYLDYVSAKNENSMGAVVSSHMESEGVARAVNCTEERAGGTCGTINQSDRNRTFGQ